MAMWRSSLAGLGLALAACGEAGQFGEPGTTFGVATAANIAAQTAYPGRSTERARARSFAAAAPGRITFAFGSAALDDAARAGLARQADWLRANPDARLSVTGHADRPGTEPANLRLGLARARAVVGALTALGITPERLDAVASAGERAPLIPTEAPERRNRRVEVALAIGPAGPVGDGLDGQRAEEVYRGYVEGTQDPLPEVEQPTVN